jgi:hypothetical protein
MSPSPCNRQVSAEQRAVDCTDQHVIGLSQELEREGHVISAEASAQGRLTSEAAFAAFSTGHLVMAAAASNADALAAACASLRKRRRPLASQPDSVSRMIAVYAPQD